MILPVYNAGGISSTYAADLNAYGPRQAKWHLIFLGVFDHKGSNDVVQKRSETARAWTNKIETDFQTQFSELVLGQYNVMEGMSAQALFGSNFDRVMELKVKFDPQNVFGSGVSVVQGEVVEKKDG